MKWISILAAVLIAKAASSAMSSSISIGPEFPVGVGTHQQKSFGTAYDGTNYLMTLQGDSNSAWAIGAQFISSTGALVSTPISLQRQGDTPTVAFDGSRYLMVWTDYAATPNDDVWGCFISKTGVKSTPFAISTATGRQVVAGIAFDGTNYLVVWTDFRNDTVDNSKGDVYGQLVSKSGALVGAEIPICNTVNSQRDPYVIFDGQKYAVVWMDKRGNNPSIWAVYGCRVNTAGGVQTPMKINQTDCLHSQNPIGLACFNNRYMVVWGKDTSADGINPSWDIYGRVLGTDGTMVTDEFVIASGDGSQAFPGVVTDGNRFMVGWTDLASPNAAVMGRSYSYDGIEYGPTFPLVRGEGPRLLSAAAYAGDKFLLTICEGLAVDEWTTSDAYGILIDPAGGSGTTLDVSVDPGAGYLGKLSDTLLSYQLTGNQSYSGTLSLNDDGKALVNGVTPGTYNLHIGGSHWLGRTITNTVVNGISQVNVALTNGDADGDGQVNLFDMVVLDQNFGKATAMADLDGDGQVNLFDYVIIDQNFGAQSD